MPGNSFGQLFRVTTFGESHGGAVGAVVDGCPPGLAIDEGEIQQELDRRRPGQSDLTTPRDEKDRIHILSGVFEGATTGTPILLLAHNRDARPQDYDTLRGLIRPGHADFTYLAKYGRRDWRGSGRASARETLARVAAGAIAQKLLRLRLGAEVVSWVERVGDVIADVEPAAVTRARVESNVVRCPDATAATRMEELIRAVRDDGDSVGGVIRGEIRGLPAGLGEPAFAKLPAELGRALLSINATRGFEIGEGFAAAALRGSAHNDPFEADGHGGARPASNRAGGSLGGISTGRAVTFRVAFKPVATIAREQQTVTVEGEPATLSAAGRHDPCVVPRAVPIVDAMAALVAIDHVLRHHAQNRWLGDCAGGA